MVPSNAVESLTVDESMTFASPPMISYVFTVALDKGLPNTSSPRVRFAAEIFMASSVVSPSVSTELR